MNYGSLFFPSFEISYFLGLRESSQRTDSLEWQNTYRNNCADASSSLQILIFSEHLFHWNVTLEISDLTRSTFYGFIKVLQG